MFCRLEQSTCNFRLKIVDILDTLDMPHAIPDPVLHVKYIDHDSVHHSQRKANIVVFLQEKKGGEKKN